MMDTQRTLSTWHAGHSTADLDHPTRALILERAREAQGASVAVLARELGVARTTVEYHARVLAKAGLVRVSVECGRAVVMPRGPKLETRAAWTWDDRTYARILRALLTLGGEAPATSVRAMNETTPERTHNHRVRRLVALGAIEERRARGERVLRLSGAAAVGATQESGATVRA